MRIGQFAVAAVAALAATAAPAATIGYSTHTYSLVVDTTRTGLIVERGPLFGIHELQAGYPGFGVGYGYALVVGNEAGFFRAAADTGGEPLERGIANAGGVLEFWVNGSDATWSAVAQGRLGGSARLVDLTTGSEWRVDYNTWPPPDVRLIDGHAYRMTFGAGGNSVGMFYPGGSARVEIRNVTSFFDVPEPGSLALVLIGIAGVALTSRLRR